MNLKKLICVCVCVCAEGEKLSAEGAEGSQRGANSPADRAGEIQGM